METDDSNDWYVIKYSSIDHGLVVLGIEHSVLRWNNYTALATKDISELNFDKNIRPACVSKVNIYFGAKDRIPTFRPVYIPVDDF